MACNQQTAGNVHADKVQQRQVIDHLTVSKTQIQKGADPSPVITLPEKMQHTIASAASQLLP